ncbi:MAG: Bug family tripartite tricarboxylate transporter substrate binding protein, partial [Burkholderiales bacterium]
MKKVSMAFAAFFLIAGICTDAALADDYPTKPITLIVPWGAGGMSDVSARMLGEKLKAILGQPIVYINKPGASGAIGLQTLKAAKPDGYTLASGALTLAVTAPYF